MCSSDLDLHELAVDDALSPHQRPKLDRYDTHLFLSCHWIDVDPASAQLHETEVDTFVNDRWMVTVRKNDGFDLDAVIERWDRSSNLAHHGVSFLLYGMLDVIVDGYFAAVETFDDYYDEVSEQIFAERPLAPAEQRRWFEMRQALVRFHRLVVPMREALSSLMRREHAAVADELYPYYQDVYDHIARLTDSLDVYQDMLTNALESYLSLVSNNLNEVMKALTSVTVMFMAPTLIAGIYGMNFTYMPELAWEYGYPFALSLMLGSVVGTFIFFRRREWI